jgi:hypothetical protein
MQTQNGWHAGLTEGPFGLVDAQHMTGLVAVLDASTGLPELLLFAYVRYCRGTGLRLTDRSARPSSAVVPE